ncbi:zinc finger protein 467-like [Denticeps clupeoides]|uniref:zinc finger protein 467-like n=1 Tax=Denticeps clupeoides TaxID=299321 RepID=UPI0010A3111B|nr:zinc finger protein 467-like [Denticeps clupeoides]
MALCSESFDSGTMSDTEMVFSSIMEVLIDAAVTELDKYLNWANGTEVGSGLPARVKYEMTREFRSFMQILSAAAVEKLLMHVDEVWMKNQNAAAPAEVLIGTQTVNSMNKEIIYEVEYELPDDKDTSSAPTEQPEPLFGCPQRPGCARKLTLGGFCCRLCGLLLKTQPNSNGHRRNRQDSTSTSNEKFQGWREGSRPQKRPRICGVACRRCSAAASPRRHLQIHARAHVCTYCGGRFSEKQRGYVYTGGTPRFGQLRCVKNERKQKILRCGQCGRTFLHSLHLRRHRKIMHTTVKCAKCLQDCGGLRELRLHGCVGQEKETSDP